MVFIGIDPGATGAMAIIEHNTTVRVFDYEDHWGLDRLRQISDERLLLGIPVKVMLERVHAMPTQGVSSMFKFGTNFGTWIGRLEALQLPFDYVTPQKWQGWAWSQWPKLYKTVTKKVQKELEVGFKTISEKKIDTKAMSIRRARDVFPEMVNHLTRKKDDGRADALNIADYCRMTERGV
jgi:hypothetical protein